MKKIGFLLVLALIMNACSVDIEGDPLSIPVYAEVISIDLPQSLESGKSYDIEVTYKLPSACHFPAGLKVSRGSSIGDERRDIYIAGVATYQSDLTTCEREGIELEIKADFSVIIDEEKPYTFYLWTGVDSEDKNVYTIIEVPVGDQTTGESS